MQRIAVRKLVICVLLLAAVGIVAWHFWRAPRAIVIRPPATEANQHSTQPAAAKSTVVTAAVENLDSINQEDSPQLRSLRLALQQTPDDLALLIEIAELERKHGRIWSALEHAQAAERLDVSNPLRAALVGDLLAGLRAFPEARAAFDRALSLAPEKTDLGLSKIATYQAEGDLRAADEALQRLPLARPQDRMLVQMRYRQHLYQHRYAEALELVDTVFGKAAVAKSANAWVRLRFHIDVGKLRQLMRHLGTANSEFQLALHLHGELRAAGADPHELASLLGAIHAGLGNKSAAISAAQDYLSSITNDHQSQQAARLQLAMIHAEFGDTASAIEHLSASLATPYGTTTAALRLDPVWAPLRGNPKFDALSAHEE